MGDALLFEVPAYATATRIELLRDEAPRTCRAVWDALPIEKPAFHARRSGKELFVLADPFKNPGPENTRLRLAGGDVLFVHLPAVWKDDHPDFTRSDAGIFDIALIYGDDALLRGPVAPIEGNLFGRVASADLPKLVELCERMWREGTELVRLRREDPA